MRRAPLLMLAGLLMALLVACGNDDDDDAAANDASGSAATATSTSDEADADADGDDGDDADGDSTATDGADSDGAEIAELLRSFQEREFRVTYDVTATAAGEDFTGRMTWYHALDGRARFDFDVTQAGQEFEVITIVTEEASYFCSDIVGSQSCVEFSEDSPLPLPDLSEPLVTQIQGLGDLRGFSSGTRETIGGLDGRCVDVDEQGVDGQICVSDEGLLLRSDVDTADGAMRFEIVDFEFEVADSSFDPPYPVSAFPGS